MTVAFGQSRYVGQQSFEPGTKFPVTHSVCDCDALGKALTDTHDLRGPVTCKFLRRGFHDTYLLTASDCRYVARVYRAQRRVSEIEYELGLLVHLAGRGVAVSAPVPDQLGGLSRTLAAPEGRRRVALFSYASGRTLIWNRSESALAGRLLASIHREADDYVSSHDRSPLDVAHLIDAPVVALRRFLDVRSDDYSSLVRLSDTLRAAVASLGHIDWGACHGDFNSGNMHISGDHRLTAFDFDFCGHGWRAYDFVGAWRQARWSEPGTWSAFVDGYRSIRPFTDADLRAVPLFDGISRVRSLGLLAANANHRGRLPVIGRKLQRHLGFLRTWERECIGAERVPGGTPA